MNDDRTAPTLTVRVWLTIDAALDNAIAHLVDGGRDTNDPDVVRAQGLRRRGWAVNGEHPERGLGFGGWPPGEARFGILLSDDDVGYLAELLVRARAITRHLLDSELPPTERLQQERSLAREDEALDALGMSR